jgi:hypothetical protein
MRPMPQRSAKPCATLHLEALPGWATLAPLNDVRPKQAAHFNIHSCAGSFRKHQRRPGPAITLR